MSLEVLCLDFAFGLDEVRGLQMALSILERGTENFPLFQFILVRSEVSISYLESVAFGDDDTWDGDPIEPETVSAYRARLLMSLARYLNSPSKAFIAEVLQTIEILVEKCDEDYSFIFLPRLTALTYREEARKSWKLASDLGCLIARLADADDEECFGELPDVWGWWCPDLWRATVLTEDRPLDSLRHLLSVCERLQELPKGPQRKVRWTLLLTLESIDLFALTTEEDWYDSQADLVESLQRVYPYLEEREREAFYRALWSLLQSELIEPGSLNLDEEGQHTLRLLYANEEEFWTLAETIL